MAAKPIGSVFLGDANRIRSLSTTPPASPRPEDIFSSLDDVVAMHFPDAHSTPGPGRPTTHPSAASAPSEPPPAPVSSELALEMRLRWLEALLFGVRGDDAKGKSKARLLPPGHTLIREAEDIQRRLDSAVEGNDGLRRFMEQYDQHAQLLAPSFALSGVLPPEATPTYENMSPEELEAFLAEMEPDIRSADRDLRDIKLLENAGVTGAGKLAEYDALRPRINALVQAYEEDAKTASVLETRIATLIEDYTSHVDALSDLFVDWDDVIAMAENKVTKLARNREERRKLGID